MRLEQNRRYVAILDLPSIPFVNVIKKAKEQLEEAGFADVTVYKASDGKFYARGMWPGVSVDADLPARVIQVWAE